MGKWVTIKGHHIYIKSPDEIDNSLKGGQFKVNSTYNKFIAAGYEENLANKSWSKSEQKRTEEMSNYVFTKTMKTGDVEEFYAEDYVDDVEKYEFPQYNKYREAEIVIGKNQLVYTQGWDENDRKVKSGGKVTGSTYYTVADNGDVIDENVVGYKTKDDAKHAAMLYIKSKYGFKEVAHKKKVVSSKTTVETSDLNDARDTTIYKTLKSRATGQVYKSAQTDGYMAYYTDDKGNANYQYFDSKAEADAWVRKFLK